MYYQLLSGIRTRGDWESWIDFFPMATAAGEAELASSPSPRWINNGRRRLLAIAPKATSAVTDCSGTFTDAPVHG